VRNYPSSVIAVDSRSNGREKASLAIESPCNPNLVLVGLRTTSMPPSSQAATPLPLDWPYRHQLPAGPCAGSKSGRTSARCGCGPHGGSSPLPKERWFFRRVPRTPQRFSALPSWIGVSGAKPSSRSLANSKSVEPHYCSTQGRLVLKAPLRNGRKVRSSPSRPEHRPLSKPSRNS
jgi:hypothetical protein